MKIFLTDSIKIKKDYQDFIFANQLFKWRLIDNNNYIDIESKSLIKIPDSNEYVGIVSPSNYLLYYDLFSLNKSITFYKPEDFAFGKRTRYRVNKNKILKEFDKFIKRSFLSYLNYENLKNLGLKRIEQYMTLLSVFSFQNTFAYDNLLLKENINIINIKNQEKTTEKIKKIKLIPFLILLNKELNYPISDIINFIMKMYARLEITDPFIEEGFVFLKKVDNEIYDIYKKIINKEVNIKILTATYIKNNNKKGTLKIKIGENSSKYIDTYLMLQTELYFEKKVLNTKAQYPNILLMYSLLKSFFPLKDFILNIYMLLKMNKIKEQNNFYYLEKELISKMNIKYNLGWINKDIWKDIYENQDYLFGHLIDPLQTKHIDFICPICQEESFTTTPQKFFCNKKGCNFMFHRTNLKHFGIEKISKEQMIEALNNKSLFIRNKEGKNYPLYLNKNDNFYHLYITEK